jgi:hypothetical protein
MIVMLNPWLSPARAQEGAFAFHIRAGGARAVAGFRDSEEGWEGRTGGGPTFGMGFTFPFWSVFDAYLGFSQFRFSCDPEVCPRGKDWVSTGFDVALRLVLGSYPVRPWLQGGFHSHRIEGRVGEGDGVESINSMGGGGYEAGGGVLIQIGERSSLSPGIRVGLGNVPFESRANMSVRFVALDLGLAIGF